MANYRIEILFSGDAPESEMERAQILGSPDVAAAVLSLSGALESHGFGHTVRAQTIRKNARKSGGQKAAALRTVAEEPALPLGRAAE